VPPGEGWTSGPFQAERRGELLYGRGAVDMKGSIASMVAAVADIPAQAGTISFIITGDEEGPARYGTIPLIALIRELDVAPDLCLVGEPTSVHRLGDMVKIGRRGSVNMWISCKGAQGHVAYPHLADNPIPRLIALLAELDAVVLDGGTDWFQPSNLEVTDLEVGNPATNVIPAEAKARISIRFNDRHTGAELVAMVEEIAHRHKGEVRAVISGESFITLPGAYSAMIAEAVKAETGLDPELSTSGGTSDARFLRAVCPVVEFGLCNATMHKKDEAVGMEDLRVLQRIYRRITLSALAQ
jgi:succinyl-diaminopimelate desuccinylase